MHCILRSWDDLDVERRRRIMEKTRHNRPKMHGMELEFKVSCVMWPRKVVFLTVLFGRNKISIFVDFFFIYHM